MVPGVDSAVAEVFGGFLGDILGGLLVEVEYAQDVFAVLGVGLEGSDAAGDDSGGSVGPAGEDSGEGGAEGSGLGGVVGESEGHDGSAEVGISESELAEFEGVFGNFGGWVASSGDEDFLGGGHDFDDVAVGDGIEVSVVVEEFQ